MSAPHTEKLKALADALSSATKAIPSGEDHDLLLVSDKYNDSIRGTRLAILECIAKLLKKTHPSLALDESAFSDDESGFNKLEELMDELLASADETLASNQSQSAQFFVAGLTRNIGEVTVLADLEKPQLKFSDDFDNFSDIFKPKLRGEKVHAIGNFSNDTQGLEDHLASINVLASDDSKKSEYGKNPYETEIKFGLKTTPQWVLEPPLLGDLNFDSVKSVDQADLTWIETKEDLGKLVMLLDEEKVISVDLEAHSTRSYLGFVCLMQISTDDDDFLLDTLALRKELYCLNKIFANPAIIKLFHGSDRDILWLQRDFGLYVVGLFDTGRAARLLGYSSASLAFALKKHCKVIANKAYQLADWRIRPLTDKMKRYAREDTRYLKYIFNQMRKELIELARLRRNGATVYADTEEDKAIPAPDTKDGFYINKVLQISSMIALKTFKPPKMNEESVQRFIGNKNLKLKARSRDRLQSLMFWREKVSQTLDESPNYVLSSAFMIRLAKSPVTTLKALRRMCNPFPPVLESNRELVSQLLKILKEEAETPVISQNEARTIKGDRVPDVKKGNQEKEEASPGDNEDPWITVSSTSFSSNNRNIFISLDLSTQERREKFNYLKLKLMREDRQLAYQTIFEAMSKEDTNTHTSQDSGKPTLQKFLAERKEPANLTTFFETKGALAADQITEVFRLSNLNRGNRRLKKTKKPILDERLKTSYKKLINPSLLEKGFQTPDSRSLFKTLRSERTSSETKQETGRRRGMTIPSPMAHDDALHYSYQKVSASLEMPGGSQFAPPGFQNTPIRMSLTSPLRSQHDHPRQRLSPLGGDARYRQKVSPRSGRRNLESVHLSPPFRPTLEPFLGQSLDAQFPRYRPQVFGGREAETLSAIPEYDLFGYERNEVSKSLFDQPLENNTFYQGSAGSPQKYQNEYTRIGYNPIKVQQSNAFSMSSNRQANMLDLGFQKPSAPSKQTSRVNFDRSWDGQGPQSMKEDSFGVFDLISDNDFPRTLT